jgi:tRNA(Ser,Leu) C12 N-acetylase TAN1
MLFATSKELMVRMKSDIKSEWEVTDLGEPTKIVGIEITRKGDSITISQVKYIEAILKKGGDAPCESRSHTARPSYSDRTKPRGERGEQE